jgi:hypothetical protein
MDVAAKAGEEGIGFRESVGKFRAVTNRAGVVAPPVLVRGEEGTT